MFGLPRHSIYLQKTNGEYENVMNADCSTKEEVKHEARYLFEKCGYKKESYIKVQYRGQNDNVLYEFSITELEGE